MVNLRQAGKPQKAVVFLSLSTSCNQRTVLCSWEKHCTETVPPWYGFLQKQFLCHQQCLQLLLELHGNVTMTWLMIKANGQYSSSVTAVTEEDCCYPFVLWEHYYPEYFRRAKNYLPFWFYWLGELRIMRAIVSLSLDQEHTLQRDTNTVKQSHGFCFYNLNYLFDVLHHINIKQRYYLELQRDRLFIRAHNYAKFCSFEMCFHSKCKCLILFLIKNRDIIMHNMNYIYNIIITQLNQKFFNCQSNMNNVKWFNLLKTLCWNYLFLYLLKVVLKLQCFHGNFRSQFPQQTYSTGNAATAVLLAI